MAHAVLLGDSIFDNGAYVSGGSPIIELLRARMSRDWRVSLFARDGAVATDVVKQLNTLPADTTHLIVSAGGNDALESVPLINMPLLESQAMLAELVETQVQFRRNYQSLIQRLRETRLPILACTIYDSVPGLSAIERMALSFFNDVIFRELIRVHIPILDLREICTESRDYSSTSPIEPSEIGGSKIARAIQQVLLSHDFSRMETVVYP